MTTECRNILRTVRLQRLDDLKILVEASLQCISQQNSKKESALSLAVSLGNVEIFDYLISKGADHNHVCIGNDTLLHLAVRNRNKALTSRLLTLGVDVNAKNAQNMAVIHLCAINGDMGTFVELLQHGANIDICARFDYTPLLFAVEYRHFDMVDFILRRGAAMTVPTGLINHPIQKLFQDPLLSMMWKKEQMWRRRRMGVWLASGFAQPMPGAPPNLLHRLPAALALNVIKYL